MVHEMWGMEISLRSFVLAIFCLFCTYVLLLLFPFICIHLFLKPTLIYVDPAVWWFQDCSSKWNTLIFHSQKVYNHTEKTMSKCMFLLVILISMLKNVRFMDSKTNRRSILFCLPTPNTCWKISLSVTIRHRMSFFHGWSETRIAPVLEGSAFRHVVIWDN